MPGGKGTQVGEGGGVAHLLHDQDIHAHAQRSSGAMDMWRSGLNPESVAHGQDMQAYLLHAHKSGRMNG